MHRRSFLALAALPLVTNPARAQDPAISLLLSLLVPIAWDILKEYLKSLPKDEAARKAQSVYTSISSLAQASEEYVAKIGAYLDSLDQHSSTSAQLEGAANAAAKQLYDSLNAFERTAAGLGAHIQVLSSGAKASIARYIDAKTHELNMVSSLARSPQVRAEFRRRLAESTKKFDELLRNMTEYLAQTYHVHE
jgi:ABC-type transporter Mla subunit MlaD